MLNPSNSNQKQPVHQPDNTPNDSIFQASKREEIPGVQINTIEYNQNQLNQQFENDIYRSLPNQDQSQISLGSSHSRGQEPIKPALNKSYYLSQQQNSQGTHLLQEQQAISQERDIIPKFLKCQQAFCYIIERMIKNAMDTPTAKINIDREIESYHQLKKKLLNQDDLKRINDQEKELLEFFQEWFLFEKEIEMLKSLKESKLECQSFDLIINYREKFDFETECLSHFITYILAKKKNELQTLKQLYQERNTLNNWKNIKDKLNVNQIQLYSMLCAINQKDPQDMFANYYMQWWLDWNQDSIFRKTQEKIE